MRKYLLTTITLLPLLLNVSHAAQSWSVDPPVTAWGFSSEDSGTGAYLGVDIMDVNADRLQALKLKEEAGVEVTMVDQDAPAGKAGIKEHDVILTMNGSPIESKAQLQRMIHETPPGRLVTMGISRDGQPMTIKVQLADRRKEFSYVTPKAKDFHFEIPPMPNLPDFELPSFVMVHSSVRSGVMVENITPQLGEFFGAKNGNGVLVRSVEKGSRGEKAGLRAGDVIVRVGDQPIHDSSDFTHALRSGTGNSVTVSVIRDKKEQTLTLTLPPRDESGEMIEESSDAEELDAATRATLTALKLAELQPQMKLASEDMRKAAQDQCKAMQKQMREQVEQLRQEYQPLVHQQVQQHAQQELQREREKLQNEMQKMQQEMQGDGLDI
jgi:membrane-associated protease RseP (regulator of RpoE activity)